MSLVALIDGKLVQMNVGPKFVLFTTNNGNPVSVNPIDVSRVEFRNGNESTIIFISGSSIRVQGSVANVSLALSSS